jgi:hypothetical protein
MKEWTSSMARWEEIQTMQAMTVCRAYKYSYSVLPKPEEKREPNSPSCLRHSYSDGTLELERNSISVGVELSTSCDTVANVDC